MAYSFPSSPAVNDVFTPSGGPTWKWTGTAWIAVPAVASTNADTLDGLDSLYFQPNIAAGTTAQYWRGDKSWQTLPPPGITDAASDGNIYARANAAWVQIPEIGGLATTEYTYNTSTSAPPGSGTFRMNSATQNAVTTIWVHDINAIGVDTSRGLAMFRKGNTILVQDKTNSANYQYYEVSAAITDSGTYTTIPVIWKSGGSNITAGRVMWAAFGLGVTEEVIGGMITIASTAPSSPAVNDVWIDTT